MIYLSEIYNDSYGKKPKLGIGSWLHGMDSIGGGISLLILREKYVTFLTFMSSIKNGVNTRCYTNQALVKDKNDIQFNEMEELLLYPNTNSWLEKISLLSIEEAMYILGTYGIDKSN